MFRNYWQTPNKIMKNRGVNKNRNNTFDSYEVIYFFGPL